MDVNWGWVHWYKRCFSIVSTLQSHTTCSCWVRAWMLNCRPDLEESWIQSMSLSYLQVFQLQGESVPSSPHCSRFNCAPRFQNYHKTMFWSLQQSQRQTLEQGCQTTTYRSKSACHLCFYVLYTKNGFAQF